MTAHLFGAGDRKKKITAVTALVLAVLITIPAHAHAQSRAGQMLTEGIGMRAAPSVRVRTLQRALAHRGFGVGAAGIDGRFGPMTTAAVRRFQARAGLAADGIVGPRTRRALHLRVTGAAGSKQGARPRNAHRRAGPGATEPKRTATPTRTRDGAKPAAPPAIPTTTSRRTPQESNVTNPWILPIALGAAAAGLIAIAAFLALAMLRALRARVERRSAAPTPTFAHGGAASATEEEPIAPRVPRDGRARAVLALVPDPDRSSDVVLLGGAGHAQPVAGERVIGYVPGRGAGVAPPDAGATATIEDACRTCGWELVEVLTDADEPSPAGRPALVAALERVDRGEVCALVVGHADHIRRLNGHAAALSDWLRAAGTGLIVQDVEPTPPAHRRAAPAAVVMLDRESPAATRLAQ